MIWYVCLEPCWQEGRREDIPWGHHACAVSGGVTQWDIETKALQGKLQGHEKPVHTVLYNGGRLFTACEDAIRVWQVGSPPLSTGAVPPLHSGMSMSMVVQACV